MVVMTPCVGKSAPNERRNVVNRTRVSWAAVAVALALMIPILSFAKGQGKAVTTPQASLEWRDTGIPGVQSAVVQGDMAKGPSHFYLKYAAGLVAPVHHHSPDHYVTVVSGNLVLILDGVEHRLSPGSYFALTGKAKHGARVEGNEACVMFVDARGPWDVVPEKTAEATP
jgi:quercetin dioxygenase-like cupin family protein